MGKNSAFGGSTDTLARKGDAAGWSDRPILAGAIRLLVLACPVIAAVLVVRIVAPSLPVPSDLAGWLIWLGCTTTVALATVVVVERLARRALPIAALFRMSLIFPDETPSRPRLALRSGTARDLQRQIVDGGSLGATEGEAAQNLLLLLGQLNRHDRLTRGHSERVRAYSDLIADQMQLRKDDRDRLHWSALAHDVGKLAVPAEVLQSPDRPTDAEWEILRGHPAAATGIVGPLRPWLGDWLSAATQHHERWDGGGYPAGLSGESIHVAGRIVAVADAFDTMTSVRSYKKPLDLADARAELSRNAGSQFDPSVVRAFMSIGLARLRVIAGPLSWLASLPASSGFSTAVTSGGMAAAGSIGTAAVAIGAVLSLGGAPAPTTDTEAAPVIERLVADSAAPTETTEAPTETSTPASATTPPSTTTTPNTPATTTAPSTATAPSTTAPSTTAPSTTTAPPTTAPSTTTAPPTTAPSTTTPSTTTPSTTAPPTTAPSTTTAPNEGEDCAAVQGGLRPVAGLDLFNCDLSGLSFSSGDLTGTNLAGANLAGANFFSATMVDGNFEGANFSDADLFRADLTGANLDFAAFVSADLQAADLRGASAQSVNFTSASLFKTQLDATHIGGSDFTDATLKSATGQPNDGPTAIWSNTTCPDGQVQSSSCFS